MPKYVVEAWFISLQLWSQGCCSREFEIGSCVWMLIKDPAIFQSSRTNFLFEAGYRFVEEASTCEFALQKRFGTWIDQHLEHIHAALIASSFTKTEPYLSLKLDIRVCGSSKQASVSSHLLQKILHLDISSS